MFRRAGLTAIALAVVAALAPAVAHAAPAGDDFDSAAEITSLPLSTTIDTTGSTKAEDDPNPCYFWGKGSVWQKYTAPSDGLLRVAAQKGSWGTMLAVYTGQRGALSLEPEACVSDGSSYTVHAKAGTTYYFMLVDYNENYDGPLSFTLRQAAPEPNDAVGSAAAVTVPSDHQPDLTLATAEPGEVPPSCDTAATRSVWYRYTPARAKFVQVSGNVISVHRESDLSEVDCATRYSSAVFAAAANETYLIRSAATPEMTERVPVALRTAPDITAGLSTWPETPNVLGDTTLGVSVGDPIYQPLAKGTIDLGDGTVLHTNGELLKHRFTRDGDYQVTVTGTTADGRTATGSRTLKVRTHDVSVSGLSVPASARAGQTKPIKASVANIRNDEDVTVVLYRVGANGEQEREIGRLTQRVAASAQGQTEFPFAYSYRAEDATAGQVTFRVRAQIGNYWSGDDKSDDNEARATTTSVRPAASANARID